MSIESLHNAVSQLLTSEYHSQLWTNFISVALPCVQNVENNNVEISFLDVCQLCEKFYRYQQRLCNDKVCYEEIYFIMVNLLSGERFDSNQSSDLWRRLSLCKIQHEEDIHAIQFLQQAWSVIKENKEEQEIILHQIIMVAFMKSISLILKYAKSFRNITHQYHSIIKKLLEFIKAGLLETGLHKNPEIAELFRQRFCKSLTKIVAKDVFRGVENWARENENSVNHEILHLWGDILRNLVEIFCIVEDEANFIKTQDIVHKSETRWNNLDVLKSSPMVDESLHLQMNRICEQAIDTEHSSSWYTRHFHSDHEQFSIIRMEFANNICKINNYNEAFQLQAQFSDRTLHLLQAVFANVTKMLPIDKPINSEYSLCAKGSAVRKDLHLFSDIDLFFLVNKSEFINHAYFKLLGNILRLHVIMLAPGVVDRNAELRVRFLQMTANIDAKPYTVSKMVASVVRNANSKDSDALSQAFSSICTVCLSESPTFWEEYDSDSKVKECSVPLSEWYTVRQLKDIIESLKKEMIGEIKITGLKTWILVLVHTIMSVLFKQGRYDCIEVTNWTTGLDGFWSESFQKSIFRLLGRLWAIRIKEEISNTVNHFSSSTNLKFFSEVINFILIPLLYSFTSNRITAGHPAVAYMEYLSITLTNPNLDPAKKAKNEETLQKLKHFWEREDSNFRTSIVRPPGAVSAEQQQILALRNQVAKEQEMRKHMQQTIQSQQRQLYQHVNPSMKLLTGETTQSKSKKDYTFTIVISQVAPQADGNIHVTAGYKLVGYVILKVKRDTKPLFMSGLTISLQQVEEVLLGDNGRYREKHLKHMNFPISEYFKDASNQPSAKGYFSWSKGVYKFPFVMETSVEYLPTYMFSPGESYNGDYAQIAERSYSLQIRYRRSVSENDQWKTVHNTRIHLHMFRKLPEIIQYSQAQEPVLVKDNKFLLRKGNVRCSVSLIEKKTVYFMFYHSIPLRVEIDNQTNFRISDVKITLRQTLYFRTSTKGAGVLLQQFILWESRLSHSTLLEFPIEKGALVATDKIVIPLNNQNIAATISPKMKTLMFIKHVIVVTISTPKQVSDIVMKLPLTILEPPIEHLAKAIYNRSMKQQSNSNLPVVNQNSPKATN